MKSVIRRILVLPVVLGCTTAEDRIEPATDLKTDSGSMGSEPVDATAPIRDAGLDAHVPDAFDAPSMDAPDLDGPYPCGYTRTCQSGEYCFTNCGAPACSSVSRDSDDAGNCPAGYGWGTCRNDSSNVSVKRCVPEFYVPYCGFKIECMGKAIVTGRNVWCTCGP